MIFEQNQKKIPEQNFGINKILGKIKKKNFGK